MKHFKLNKDRGFTLIELMLVISIIAIIVAIVYANFSFAKADGRNAKRAEDSVQLRNALTAYSIDHNGDVPAGSAAAGCSPVYNSSDVQTSWVCNSASPQGLSVVLTPLVSGGYISAIPKDPVNSNGLAYYYVTGLQTQTDPKTGAALTSAASFRYVAEGANGASPAISGTDAGTPDYTDYPGSGYPVAGGGAVVPGTTAPTVSVSITPLGTYTQNQSVKLTWSSTNAATCQIQDTSQIYGGDIGGSMASAGSLTASVSTVADGGDDKSGTITVTCYSGNLTGLSGSASVSVQVSTTQDPGYNNNPPTVSLYMTPSDNVNTGDQVTLSWYSSGAQSCGLTQDGTRMYGAFVGGSIGSTNGSLGPNTVDGAQSGTITMTCYTGTFVGNTPTGVSGSASINIVVDGLPPGGGH